MPGTCARRSEGYGAKPNQPGFVGSHIGANGGEARSRYACSVCKRHRYHGEKQQYRKGCRFRQGGRGRPSQVSFQWGLEAAGRAFQGEGGNSQGRDLERGACVALLGKRVTGGGNRIWGRREGKEEEAVA